MSKIPDDIMKAADEALRLASTEVFRPDAAVIIAKAIIVGRKSAQALERERCALIAEARGRSACQRDEHDYCRTEAKGLCDCAGFDDLAAKIRSGE